MNQNETILVVEDEADIRALLVFNLEKEGYTVLEADNGQSALDVARKKKPNLILLDLMLPIVDGLTVSKVLAREQSTIPIIMLTAKGEDIDKILGLELGADDYVVKPFNVRELILRIKACLKRHTPQVPKDNKDNHRIEIASIVLDTEAHTISIDGNIINTTLTEFRLLEDLMRHVGHVRTREQLLNSVWGYEFEGYGRTVDTHIRRLRAKMLEKSDIIDTVRGIGYRFKNN